MADTVSTIPSQEHTWPGENNPSRLDVEVATALPEPKLLSDFKKSLLASQDVVGSQDLMRVDLDSLVNPGKCFMYPLTFISELPPIPSSSHLVRFRQAFLSCYTSHLFLGALPLTQPLRDSTVPPFQLAVGCLGSMQLRCPGKESGDLCLAGMSLWAAMTEIDNREARSLEMLLSIVLLGMYAVMSTDSTIQPQIGLMHCASLTISRRLRMHDPAQLQISPGARGLSSRGSIMWCLWLNDVIYALHLDLGVNGFSSRELWTKMPISPYQFQDIYKALMDTNDLQSPLLADLVTDDDAVLLLTAIQSDLLYLRRTLANWVKIERDPSAPYQKQTGNPYVPLTPRAELDRLYRILGSALNKWGGQFHPCATSEVLAFYYYCKLQLVCPDLYDLPRLADYKPLSARSKMTPRGLCISNEAICMAWLILDSAAERPKSAWLDKLCPIWLPICVFHAALVVWAKQVFNVPKTSEEHCSIRMLLAFKLELETMPWPCCSEMMVTLDKLMAQSPVPLGAAKMI